jgi:hypothetical protein
LKDNGLEPSVYIDEGMNEVPAMSATALVFWRPDDEPAEFMAGFNLLKERKKGWWRG